MVLDSTKDHAVHSNVGFGSVLYILWYLDNVAVEFGYI